MEKPQQHVAPAAAKASGFITDADPQFWKKTLNSGKVKSPLKTTLFEGVKIIFGATKKNSASVIYVACPFCKTNGQI